MTKLMNEMDEMERIEEERIERAGLDSRNGLRTFNYCAQRYRYFCGECEEEITKEGDCQCGWRTIEFRDVGI